MNAADSSLEELQAALQRLGRLLGSRQALARVGAAAGVDVSAQGAALLRALQRGGEQATASLAAAAAMDVGAVSRQLTILETAGAIARTVDERDRRVVRVALTPKGRRMAADLHAARLAHLRAALEGWTAEERRACAAHLDRLVGSLLSTPVPGPPRGRRERQA